MKVLVVGAGAVGGYYGAMLSRAGHDVTFVARGEHARAIEERGLTVETPEGTLVCHAKVLRSAADAAGLGADLALVAVKLGSLAEVAPAVGAALGAGGVAVPLQNGLDSEQVLAAAIGAERVVGGVANIASRLVEPGRVKVEAPARITLAPLAPADLPRATRLAAELDAAGFRCDARADLGRVLWTKLLWNAPFNAVCALTDLPAGDVLAVPELEALVRAAMQEVRAVAAAEGVTLEARAVDATIDGTRAHFAATIPSMLQDVRAGRPTEARDLQGAVVTRGARHAVPTPVHSTLLALVVGLGVARARRM